MPDTPKEALQSKYGLQIATYLYVQGKSTGREIESDTGIPDGTMWRNIRKMKELDMMLQEDNQYYLNQKTKNFIEKLMDEAGYKPETYLEIMQEHNYFKKRLRRLREGYEQVLENE